MRSGVIYRRGKVDTFIVVDFRLDDLKTINRSASQEQIKAYVKDKHGLEVSLLNIAKIEQKMGIIESHGYK